jgi:hypothetical protein
VIVALLLLTALAFGALGLWWGERGRRIAAENREIYGNPVTGPASVRQTDTDTPEARAAEAMPFVSEATVERGARALMAQARLDGKPLSYPDAEKMAKDMLGRAGPFEADGGPEF